MIKPSDIPTDLAEYLCSASDFAPQHSRCLVANILNAAIEEGIVVRRIPDADDSRVLRRAILLMEKSWLQGMGLRNTKHYIEKARKELESEESK